MNAFDELTINSATCDSKIVPIPHSANSGDWGGVIGASRDGSGQGPGGVPREAITAAGCCRE